MYNSIQAIDVMMIHQWPTNLKLAEAERYILLILRWLCKHRVSKKK